MEFPVQDVDLSRLLTEYDVTFGYNAMEVRMHADSKRRFGAMLTLRNYRELSLNSLDLVLQAPVEFIITESFEFIPASIAMQVYESQKEVFLTSKVQQLPEKIGLKDILASNKGRKTDFGQHQMNVFILADTIKSLETGVANMAKALVSIGMTPIREDIKLEECYWAQLPGNFEFIQRMQAINTERIAGFANLNNFPGGSERNNHWGPAVTTFYTAARTPYFFNFHQGDNGHTMIIGQAGAGKTVLLNFLLAEARKFDNKIFYFDYDRSAEILLRSLGGSYYDPYAGADKRPYAQLSFNPFALEDTKENKDFLRSWLSSLVSYSDAGALEAACEQAVAAVMQREKGQRNLKSCIECMRSHNPAIADAFLPWTEGERAGIFAANQDSLNFSDKIYGFEMNHAMQDKAAVVPIVSYLLYCILQSLDGSPAILVMDEAWDMLDNAYFAPRLASLFDTLRAKNAMVIFATDHADRACQSTINSLLLDKVATQIYLPDADADEHYAQAFGLTNTEISYIAVMNVEDRHFLIKHDQHTIVCELNLAGMSDIISVLSSVPKNLEIMEEAISKNGLSPQQWMPAFLEKI
jgi:type IV secretion system protein VirB4